MILRKRFELSPVLLALQTIFTNKAYHQKTVENEDKRILILSGASHIAMFKDFIDQNPKWKTIELKEIMEK